MLRFDNVVLNEYNYYCIILDKFARFLSSNQSLISLALQSQLQAYSQFRFTEITLNTQRVRSALRRQKYYSDIVSALKSKQNEASMPCESHLCLHNVWTLSLWLSLLPYR